MKPLPSLYPPRARATNVALIKNVRAAQTQDEFEAADREIAGNLHPSLFAELDWMEMTMPESSREAGRRLVDGIFFYHLPSILSMRRLEFDLPHEELRREIAENLDFYQSCLKDDTRPLDALGGDPSRKIQALSGSVIPNPEESAARSCAAQRPKIAELLNGITDGDWLLLSIEVEIQNALALSLDHVSSRMRTKKFLRRMGGSFPSLKVFSVSSRGELAVLRERLDSLAGLARESGVTGLAGVCYAWRDVLADAEPSRFQNFAGQLAAGYGSCGDCSMMYASSAIVSFDPTCPGLDVKGERIYFPFHFNVSVCPFCGSEQRANTPSMFYSPGRNQVIYNCPRMGPCTEEEARERSRPMLDEIRRSYKARIDEADARRFETAREEITYSVSQFLLAIQMGTTASEEHVYLAAELLDGSGLLCDPSKGVMIELTRREMNEIRPRGRFVEGAREVTDSGGEGGLSVKEAMRLFANGQYEQARDVLERLHGKSPNDSIVRRNLAAVYFKLGNLEAARQAIRE